MTKQLGRNPDVSRVLATNGIPAAVTVDLACAIAASNGGLRIGHLGHLVQIPRYRGVPRRLARPVTTGRCSATRRRRRPVPRPSRAARCRSSCCASSPRATASTPGTRAASRPTTWSRWPTASTASPACGSRGSPLSRRRSSTRTRAAAATPNRTTLARRCRGAARFRPRRRAAERPGHHLGVGARAARRRRAPHRWSPGHGLTGTTPVTPSSDLVEEPAIAYLSEVSHLWNVRPTSSAAGSTSIRSSATRARRRSSCRRRPRSPRPSRDRSRCRRPRRLTTTRTSPSARRADAAPR